MIKGHYIGTIVIDTNYPEDDPDLRPFDEIQANWETLNQEIEKILKNEVGDDGGKTVSVSVSKRYSHIYKSEDKA